MSIPEVVNTELGSIKIPYEFMRWTTSPAPDTYVIGEYSETPTDTEDGYEEGMMMLTCTTRKSWQDLENIKQTIKRHFPNPYGLRKSMEDGAVAIFYENAFPIDTGDAVLKRIQINLKIKIWRGK